MSDPEVKRDKYSFPWLANTNTNSSNKWEFQVANAADDGTATWQYSKWQDYCWR